MRTHYGPWQPCWISNQHQKHKSGRGPSSEHFWQVWLISVQQFQRGRFKCEKLTDRRTDAYPWQKLTWPMARWAKNKQHQIEPFENIRSTFPQFTAWKHHRKIILCFHYNILFIFVRLTNILYDFPHQVHCTTVLI